MQVFEFDEKSLALAQKQLEAIHKGQHIFMDIDEDHIEVPRLELSLPSLNKILSNHYAGERAGFALGKIYNFYGPESIGKSALALYIAGEFYKKGLSVHWIDKEHSFDPEYALDAFGLDAWNKSKRVTISKPDNAEQAFDTIQSLVDNEAVHLIVVDSIAALGTADQNAKTAEEKSMAETARKLSEHFPRIISKMGKANISIIYINQLRANISMGMAFGSKPTGGNAMRFYPHISLEFKKPKSGDLYKGDEFIGQTVDITAAKNKTARPKLKANFVLFPGEGFSIESDILELAVKTGVIIKAGAWYKWEDGSPIAQGVDKVRHMLKDDAELTKSIWQKTSARLDQQIDENTGEIIEQNDEE